MSECNVTVIAQMVRAIKILVFFIGTKLVARRRDSPDAEKARGVCECSVS
jgi:hypothetical protein